MEFLEGSTLGSRLENGTLSLDEAPVFLAQICDALDAAHAENIVHRDLKPENIWICTPRRGRPFVKLLDFGIAKLIAAADQSSTQTGAVMGTPHYMSPEQCHGRAVDHRTDIYAMGVILYRFYAGRLPFEGETFMEVLTKQVTLAPDPPSMYASIPPALDKLIMACLAKDPANRPQSARELGSALEAIFSTSSLPLAISTPPIGVSTTLGASAAEIPRQPVVAPPARGKRVWVGVAAGLVALVVLVVALAATHHSQQPPSLQMAGGPPAAQPAATAPPPPPAPAPVAPPPPREPESPAGAPVAKKQRRTPLRAERPNEETPPKPARTRASETGLARDNPFQ
jgi:serine/threonine protein kinase